MKELVKDAIAEEIAYVIGNLQYSKEPLKDRKLQVEYLLYLQKTLEEFDEEPEVEVQIKPYQKFYERIVENPQLLAVLGNIVGIGMILNYERTHVLTSRAYNFIRPK